MIRRFESVNIKNRIQKLDLNKNILRVLFMGFKQCIDKPQTKSEEALRTSFLWIVSGLTQNDPHTFMPLRWSGAGGPKFRRFKAEPG